MKKLIITISVALVLTFVFLFAFRSCASATDVTPDESLETDAGGLSDTENGEEKTDIKEYIKERIIPVLVGVLTSVSALLATLAGIRSSLAKIRSAKESFEKEAKNRDTSFKAQSEYLNAKAEELKKIVSDIPRLEKQLIALEESTKKLITECTYIGKMVSLGFSQNKDVIKSGNGAKISGLLAECERLSCKEE